MKAIYAGQADNIKETPAALVVRTLRTDRIFRYAPI